MAIRLVVNGLREIKKSVMSVRRNVISSSCFVLGDGCMRHPESSDEYETDDIGEESGPFFHERPKQSFRYARHRKFEDEQRDDDCK